MTSFGVLSHTPLEKMDGRGVYAEPLTWRTHRSSGGLEAKIAQIAFFALLLELLSILRNLRFCARTFSSGWLERVSTLLGEG